MPRYILRLETPAGPRYMEWSTIVDAPVTYGVTLEEFTAYYKERYGTEGMKDLPERLERVEHTGFSGADGSTLAGLIACNRAGERESELTLAEIVEKYCTNRPTHNQKETHMAWEIIHDVPFERVRRMPVAGGYLIQTEIDEQSDGPSITTTRRTGWHAPIYVHWMELKWDWV